MDKLFISRFIKGIASTSLATVLQIGLGMLGLMIAARVISKGQFGMFVLINVLTIFFVILSGLAQESIGVTRCITAAPEAERPELINSVLGFRLVIMPVVCLIIIASKPLLQLIAKDESLYYLLNYVPVIFALQGIDDLLRKVMQGLHMYRKLAMAYGFQAVLRFTLTIFLLLVIHMDVLGMIYAVIIAYSGSIVYQWMSIPWKARPAWNLRQIKRIFRFGFPLGVNGVLTFIFTYLDNFMIAAILNPVQVACYAIAARIPESIRRMYSSFYDVFFPSMSELLSAGRYAEASKVMNLSLRSIAFLAGLLTIGIAMFAREIVVLLFSDKYLTSAVALALLMLNLCVNIVANILGSTLVALGRADTPVKINSVTTVLNLTGNLVMIPMFGFIGAVYATLLASVITNPVILYFYRNTQLEVKQGSYLKPMAILAGVWGAYALLGVETVPIKVAAVLLYLILSYAVGTVTTADFTRLKSMGEKLGVIRTERAAG